MNEQNIAWLPRINIKPSVKKRVEALAREEMRSVASTIGILLQKATQESSR